MSYLGGNTDITVKVQSILRYPLQNRLFHLNTISEQIPFKDLQNIFPDIINSIFGNSGMTEDWGLRRLTREYHPFDYRLLHEFLSPNGGLFHIIYKLIADPQTRYTLPVRDLPMDFYDMLQSKRIPKFYLDTLVFEPQNRHIVSLTLNPFDFYIFHFAIHLCNHLPTKSGWESWNTLYYTLACDYLLHFLPRDPNSAILPYIPYYTGKTPVVSPLQTVNSFRQCQFPSLFTCQEVSVNAGITSTSQLHPRGEMWRSESVLQIFIDVWLNKTIQTALSSDTSSPNARNSYPASEHVRISRILVKQCHSFATSASDDMTSLGELRRITTAILAPRAFQHVQHLMQTWPLDSSFRLVLELWFSFIQPWRYASIKDDNNDQLLEDNHRTPSVDRSFLPFISENLPAYTEIFHLVMPRFLRLDLTVSKNAIMLFRLTKVFAQTNLVDLLKEAERNINLDNDSMDTITNNNVVNDNSQGESSFMSVFSKYSLAEPTYLTQGKRLQLLSSRQYASELMMMAQHAYKIVQDNIRTKETQSFMHKQGFFKSVINFLFGESDTYDETPFEEMKKVPLYLNSSIQQLAQIFSLSVSERCESPVDQIRLPNVSSSSRQTAMLSPVKAKERLSNIKYLGDPELEPIKTYENGFLVKMCRYISLKINDTYSQEIGKLWERQDLIGTIGKEIIRKPLTIHHFSKNEYNTRVLLTETLPPRITMRSFASHRFIFWISFFCFICYALGYSVLLSNFTLLILYSGFICVKGFFRHFFGNYLTHGEGNLSRSNDFSFMDSSN